MIVKKWEFLITIERPVSVSVLIVIIVWTPSVLGLTTPPVVVNATSQKCVRLVNISTGRHVVVPVRVNVVLRDTSTTRLLVNVRKYVRKSNVFGARGGTMKNVLVNRFVGI